MDKMKINLSFWRFVIILSFAGSLFWGKGRDTYLIHVGTFTGEKNTAIKIVILPLCIMIGFVS